MALRNPGGDPSWLRVRRVGQYFGRLSIFNYVVKSKNVIYFTPHPVPHSIAVDRIAVYASVVGDADARARIGIYLDDGTGNPGALMVDGGEMDFSAGVGIKAAVVALTLPTPLVWLAFLQTFTAVSPTISVCYGGDGSPLGCASDLGTIHGGSAAQAYGALPDPAPAITTMEAFSVMIATRRA